MSTNQFDILIVGGGTAGITVAAQLRNRLGQSSMAIVEPASKHYYQPLWTLVGAGIVPMKASEREERDFIPQGVNWIQDRVASFNPEQNQVKLASGQDVTYKHLVVCPGIQIDWHKVEGLEGQVGLNGVCSNYAKDHVEKTWEFIREMKSGEALFTFPSTPIKCAGAPQKIMYLAEDYWRKQGVRDKINVTIVSAGGAIFGVQKYKEALNKVIASRGMNTEFGYDLTKIDPNTKEATFRNMKEGEPLVKKYDMIHVAPPMSAPDFIKSSPLAAESGWVDVDKYNMRHTKYDNVFALGDASSLPTSRTGAAIRKQVPVLVDHLAADINGGKSEMKYNGYTSCPLVTSYSKLILAEFDYDGNPAETFPFDQGKERTSMYLLKRFGLPFLYWNGMLRGHG